MKPRNAEADSPRPNSFVITFEKLLYDVTIASASPDNIDIVEVKSKPSSSLRNLDRRTFLELSFRYLEVCRLFLKFDISTSEPVPKLHFKKSKNFLSLLV